MQELICRLTAEGNSVKSSLEYVENWKVVGLLETEPKQTVQELIESDKRFGVLIPRDGKSFAFKVLNADSEITIKNVEKGVRDALWKWKYAHAGLGLDKQLLFDFHKCKRGERPDVTYEFRDITTDPLLDNKTIAYVYYTMGGLNNGICVVNKLFYYNGHGRGVSMHLIDPVHYPDPNTVVKLADIDIDVVLYHEPGHGIFVLGHTMDGGHGMSANYSYMSENPTMQDFLRAAAKVGTKIVRRGFGSIFWNWLQVRAEK